MRALLLTFLLMTPTALMASDPSTPKKMAAHFLATLQDEDATDARLQDIYVSLYPEKIDSREAARAVQQIRTIIALNGDPSGFELIDERDLGEALVRLTYVMLGKESPTPFHFLFYRTPDEGWKLTNFRVNDSTDSLM